ncbi:MAG: nucleoside triphosphate pyrophosphatase [Solirubrobacterales bacterium]
MAGGFGATRRSSVKIVLASQSPQRRDLLAGLGVRFEVVVPATDELTRGDPRELVEANALAKAREVHRLTQPGLVIAGDTEVVLDGEVLGQPADEAQAREYLRALSGREHEVLGGLAVIQGDPAREVSGVETSIVHFREIDDPLLGAYIASGEWQGRAGGYAVQGLGAALVDSVRGDLSNVIGLPVGLLARLAPEVISAGART